MNNLNCLELQCFADILEQETNSTQAQNCFVKTWNSKHGQIQNRERKNTVANQHQNFWNKSAEGLGVGGTEDSQSLLHRFCRFKVAGWIGLGPRLGWFGFKDWVGLSKSYKGLVARKMVEEESPLHRIASQLPDFRRWLASPMHRIHRPPRLPVFSHPPITVVRLRYPP